MSGILEKKVYNTANVSHVSGLEENKDEVRLFSVADFRNLDG